MLTYNSPHNAELLSLSTRYLEKEHIPCSPDCMHKTIDSIVKTILSMLKHTVYYS